MGTLRSGPQCRDKAEELIPLPLDAPPTPTTLPAEVEFETWFDSHQNRKIPGEISFQLDSIQLRTDLKIKRVKVRGERNSFTLGQDPQLQFKGNCTFK